MLHHLAVVAAAAQVYVFSTNATPKSYTATAEEEKKQAAALHFPVGFGGGAGNHVLFLHEEAQCVKQEATAVGLMPTPQTHYYLSLAGSQEDFNKIARTCCLYWCLFN